MLITLSDRGKVEEQLPASCRLPATNQQQPGTAANAPDLTKSCAKECPNAANNDDALKCIEKMETSQGEATFKKKHRTCYNAHEKYEKQTGKEKAGEAGEEGESS